MIFKSQNTIALVNSKRREIDRIVCNTIAIMTANVLIEQL